MFKIYRIYKNKIHDEHFINTTYEKWVVIHDRNILTIEKANDYI